MGGYLFSFGGAPSFSGFGPFRYTTANELRTLDEPGRSAWFTRVELIAEYAARGARKAAQLERSTRIGRSAPPP